MEKNSEQTTKGFGLRYILATDPIVNAASVDQPLTSDGLALRLLDDDTCILKQKNRPGLMAGNLGKLIIEIITAYEKAEKARRKRDRIAAA